jgi:hypothetical protein
MVTSWANAREDFREPLSSFNKINGRHEETRTPDLYRVNFEVNNLKPFPYLAFPHSITLEMVRKQPSFDGELMASRLTFPPSFVYSPLAPFQDWDAKSAFFQTLSS